MMSLGGNVRRLERYDDSNLYWERECLFKPSLVEPITLKVV